MAAECGGKAVVSSRALGATAKVHDRRSGRPVAAILVFIATFASAVGATAMQPTAAAGAPRPVVYFTFDDGPDATVTGRILDILDRHNARATFFVTGSRVPAYPAVTRRIVTDGHAIANHSWSHPVLTSLSDGAVRSQFQSTNDVVARMTGVRPTCYRPPYGAVDARIHRLAVESGLPNAHWTAAGNHYGLWDIDTQDWRRSYSRTRYELSKVSDGDVVLMHSLAPFSAQVFGEWMAANAHRFEFRALAGCGGTPSEPPVTVEPAIPADPARWYRYQVARLYVAYFDRAPDDGGARYWNTLFARGALSLDEISDAFADSTEFAGRYQQVDNRRFVALVYENILDRQPDPRGWDYWTALLNRGRLTRGEMMVQFSESTEFVRLAAPVATAEAWNGDPASSYRRGIELNVWPGPND